MMAFGTIFWAIGLGAVGLSKSFWFFVISMIIVTTGELIASPTATALTAHLAPEALRGRYMSLYSLTITLSSGLGPVFGGLLNDLISPSAVWYGGSIVSILCVIWFVVLYNRFPQVMEQLKQFNSDASSGGVSS
jgi:MFS family permease